MKTFQGHTDCTAYADSDDDKSNLIIIIAADMA
jgi:hypothetical protein